MKLYISGGRHVMVDVEGRFNNLSDAVDDPDILFEESRVCNANFSERVLHWIITPFLLIPLSGWLRVGIPGLKRILPGDSDTDLIDRTSESFDLSGYPVDRSIHSIIREERWMWAGGNWFMLIPSTVLLFGSGFSSIAVVFTGFSAAIAASSISFLFLAGFSEAREIHMLREISSKAAEKDIDEGVLVTGGKHVNRLERYSDIVENIDPIIVENE